MGEDGRYEGIFDLLKCDRIGKERRKDEPSSLLIQPSRTISDLLVGIATHIMSCLLLDEVESCVNKYALADIHPQRMCANENEMRRERKS